MRLKLDENLPAEATDVLANRDHEVDTVVDEGFRGSTDSVVVRAASDERRMFVTLDRGVGDIRRFPPGSHAGVVVLRPISQDPGSIIELIDRLLSAHDMTEFSGCVVIVEPARVRVRRPENPAET